MNFMTLSSPRSWWAGFPRANSHTTKEGSKFDSPAGLADARVGGGHSVGIVGGSVDDPLRWDRLLSRAPWTGPGGRDGVELVGQQIGEGLVIDPPPLEVGPGLVGRALQ